MKLAWVKFDCQQKFDDDTVSDEAHQVVHGDIEWLTDQNVITVGMRVFPLSHVKAMVRAEIGPTCPECGHSFMDARALGAHRHHKHGVKGARFRDE